MNYDDVIVKLQNLADEKFRAFTSRLLNTSLCVYGVRTPALRALGREIKKGYPTFADDFFARGEYSFEEVLLCGWQLGKDYDENVRLLKRLIPRMASWAHTDQVLARLDWVSDPEPFLSEFAYLTAGGEYEARAYVMMLFELCVRADRLELIFTRLPAVPPGRYYVDMAVAWLVCEVIVKFYDEGLRLLTAGFLTPRTIKKAVSKCRDSFRLTDEQKRELRAVAARLTG